MKLKKRSSRCGRSLRNQGERKGDKGRKCRMKRIFYLDPRRPRRWKKKCNRMVTVRTQTRRREGIKLGLTFETRWNVIRHRDKTPFSFADWIKSFFLSTWILFLSLLNLILHSLFCITRSTRDRWNSCIFSSNFQWSSNIGAIRSVYFLIFLDRTCFFLVWQFI